MKLLLSEKIQTEAQMQLFAHKVAGQLPKGATLLLQGPMAAGKTTFVRFFCSVLGISLVQSPTYAIHQRYHGKGAVVDHFDLYRLETEEQLESAGVYDLLAQPADYKVVEWPERIGAQNFFSDNLFRLLIEIESDQTRVLTLAKLS